MLTNHRLKIARFRGQITDEIVDRCRDTILQTVVQKILVEIKPILKSLMRDHTELIEDLLSKLNSLACEYEYLYLYISNL